MPSQLHMGFGYGPPRAFAARSGNGRNLVKAASGAPDPDSFFFGSIVRGGDYVTVAKTSIPGNYVATMDALGVVRVQAHGDKTRQEVEAELYSRKLQMWTGDSRQFINNRGPVGTFIVLSLTVGVPMVSIALLGLFSDLDNDLLELEGTSGSPPTGTTVLDGILKGTPSAPGSGTLNIFARDPANAIGSAKITWTIAPSAVTARAGSLVSEQRLKTLVGGALVG